jgi:endonuclease YncB( thermonuclease family)
MGCINNKPLTSNQEKLLLEADANTYPDFTLAGKTAWGKAVSVYDGDTFRVLCFMNKKDTIPVKYNIRVNGCNCPEIVPRKKHKNRDIEMKEGKIARNRFLQLVTDQPVQLNKNYSKNDIKQIMEKNKKIIFIKFSDAGGFNRILADIYESDKSILSINQQMINEGYAIEYHGEKHDNLDLTLPNRINIDLDE